MNSISQSQILLSHATGSTQRAGIPAIGAGVLIGGAVVVGCLLCSLNIEGGANQLSGWVLLSGLLFSTVMNYLIRRDVLYPATVFSAVWLLASAFYVFFPFEIDQLSWTTVWILLCGHLFFGMGCALGSRPWISGKTLFTAPPRNQLRRALLVYSVAMVPIVLYSAMRLAGVWSISSALFISLRDAIVAGQTDGTAVYGNVLVSIAPTVSVSVALLLCMEESERWLRRLGLVVAFALSLLTTGRPLLLLLASGWLMFTLLQKRDRTVSYAIRRLIWLSLLILVCLTSVTLLTKRETQADQVGDTSAVGVATKMTAYYIAGPLAGFNYVVQHPEAYFDSDNFTFAQILKPLSQVGFKYDAPPEIDPFLPVPFLINVFTAFRNYYVDFGVAGCLTAFLLLGTICGGVFDAAARKNQLAMFVYAYLFFAVLFTPFQDVYHSFGRYVYVICFISLYYAASRRLPVMRMFQAPKEVIA